MDGLNDIQLERVTGGMSAANAAQFTAEQQQAAIDAAQPGSTRSHFHGIVSRIAQGQKSY